MALIRFLASGTGRVTRIVAGVILIAVGFRLITGITGVVVEVIGVVPLLAGAFDVCVFGPLFGQPFRGAAIRAHTA